LGSRLKTLAVTASFIAPLSAIADEIDTIVITSSRIDLLGNADTASQGSVTK